MDELTLGEILAELVRKRLSVKHDNTDDTIKHYHQAEQAVIKWAKRNARVDVNKLATRMTKRSEYKHHGHAFTYNYIVDDISQNIADNLGEILTLENK